MLRLRRVVFRSDGADTMVPAFATMLTCADPNVVPDARARPRLLFAAALQNENLFL